MDSIDVLLFFNEDDVLDFRKWKFGISMNAVVDSFRSYRSVNKVDFLDLKK